MRALHIVAIGSGETISEANKNQLNRLTMNQLLRAAGEVAESGLPVAPRRVREISKEFSDNKMETQIRIEKMTEGG